MDFFIFFEINRNGHEEKLFDHLLIEPSRKSFLERLIDLRRKLVFKVDFFMRQKKDMFVLHIMSGKIKI